MLPIVFYYDIILSTSQFWNTLKEQCNSVLIILLGSKLIQRLPYENDIKIQVIKVIF